MKEALFRMFSTAHCKGTKNYINTQKKYEVIRTLIYFFISVSLYIAGYVTTKTNANLLTVVAVVGCLPASKSLVGAIMFLRHKSMSAEACVKIEAVRKTLPQLFDMVFTTYDKNHVVGHMVIAGNTICGYTENKNFQEKDFNTHIQNVLKTDGHKNVSVKIFKDLNKYLERIEQLEELEAENANILGIMDTLKSVAL
ncbi:MAG: hypothetical protein IJ379_04115 [Lachnospiraceae bacterium]|nr:hypothetical protein [Lachnospiraceae bacterium]